MRATSERDGLMAKLGSVGAKGLANACGPGIGQWQRDEIKPGQANSIISSFNRNFPKRNDGNAETLSFLASPEIVVAYALAGRLSFNPLTDTLVAADGSEYRLDAPAPAPDVPAQGFADGGAGYTAPPDVGRSVQVKVAPDSERLQLLVSFARWPPRTNFCNRPSAINSCRKVIAGS